MGRRFLQVLAMLSLGAFSLPSLARETPPLIAYSQIIAHPALSAIYQGMIEELENAGYQIGKDFRIDYQIAQGDMAINTQIAQKFAGDKPALIVASTTPSAQAVLAAVRGAIPVVFTGVTDPIGARLVGNLEKPGGNVTGVRESIAYAAMLDTIAEVLPETKRIGTIFNPGEDNSHASNAILEKMCAARGLTFLAAPAANTAEVLDATRSLVGRVDVILTTLDNTVASAIASVVQVADRNAIPLFTFDTFSVAKGAAVGVGYDEYDVGRLTARKVAAILRGAKAGDLAVSAVEKTRIVLNPAAAARQGVPLDQAIRARATQILPEK